MRREITAAALIGIGIAGFTAAWLVRHEQDAKFAPRPEASGDVGAVAVYAQQPSGPVRLQPGRLRTLERPQGIAFQLTASGTGPRLVRIELEAGDRRTVLHEQRMEAPADQEMVDHVIDLGDELPDELAIIVAVEAPHTFGYESRYPVRLVGSKKRSQEVGKPGRDGADPPL